MHSLFVSGGPYKSLAKCYISVKVLIHPGHVISKKVDPIATGLVWFLCDIFPFHSRGLSRVVKCSNFWSAKHFTGQEADKLLIVSSSLRYQATELKWHIKLCIKNIKCSSGKDSEGWSWNFNLIYALYVI